MSTKYEYSSTVPTDKLCERLIELSEAVTRNAVNSEFTMHVPAECDRDADLVLSEAAMRLKTFEREIVRLSDIVGGQDRYLSNKILEGG